MPPRKATATQVELPWNEDNPARLLLYDELVLGNIQNSMGPAEVWETYKNTREFKLPGMIYDSTFTRRLRDLRAIVARDHNRSLEDRAALAIALRNHPPPEKNHRGEPQWNGSKAQKLLKKDIKEKTFGDTIKPEELRMKRVEYQEFELPTFRWKIQQICRTKKYRRQLRQEKAEKIKKATPKST